MILVQPTIGLLTTFLLASSVTSAQSPSTTTSKPAYCGTEWYSVYAPTYTIFDESPSATPPLPCPGIYTPQNGFCCSGHCVSCPGYSGCLLSNVNLSSSTSYPNLINYTIPSTETLRLTGRGLDAFDLLARSNINGSNSGDELGFEPPNAAGCSCSDGDIVYQLPFEPCVEGNPFYTGCPGNMGVGICCSGPGISFDNPDDDDDDGPSTSEDWGINNADTNTCSASVVPSVNAPESSWSATCMYNTALYAVSTLEDGTATTSTLPPGIGYSNTRCYTCPLYTSSTPGTEPSRTAGAAGAAALITAGPVSNNLVRGAVIGAMMGLGVV